MSNPNSVSSSSLKVRSSKIDEHAAQIKQLRRIWNRAHRHDVVVRHRTGQLLNQWFGSPDQRQVYGERTLRRYAAAARLHVSDLSRMRWFAFNFPSLDDLKAKHPQVRTWSAIRKLLAQLNSQHAGDATNDTSAGQSGDSKRSRTFASVLGRLKADRKTLDTVILTLSNEEREALRQVAAEILKAVSEHGGPNQVPIADLQPALEG